MIDIKYTYKYGQGEYLYKDFDSYEEFGIWVHENYHDIVIWEVS